MSENCQDNCTITKETQVTTQVNALDKAIRFYDDTVCRLEQRLQCVTVEPEEAKEVGIGTPHPCLVPLASELYGQRGRLSSLTDRLCVLLDNLEI